MLRFIFALLLLIPTPVFAYHTETQTPYGINISVDSENGEIELTWQESDALEDNPPEYYRLYFGDDDQAADYSIDTSFGFNEALSWRTYYFTPEYIYEKFETTTLTFYAKIQARNDTGGTVSDLTAVVSVKYDYVYIPTTTTSSTTTTITTTTTTTLPKAKDVVEDGVTTYLAWDKNGCEHPDNPLSYKEYLTAIESKKWFGYQPGDCKEPVKEEVAPTTTTTLPPTEKELNFVETGFYETNAERKAREEAEAEAALIKAEEDAIKEELKDTDLDIPEKDIQEFVEVIKEVEEFVKTLDVVEEVIDIPEVIIIKIDEVEDEPIVVVETKEVVEEVLDEPIQEIIEEKSVENYTEEDIEIVQAVVKEAVENVENLTPEQVEVVADVLKVETEDVVIIAEAVKSDEVVAKAVEIFVERAVENADVEDYTLADVVTEIQFENFIENPIKVLIDFDTIDITTIGNDMTQDQKEKAQEVVVPVILTRIATMAAFIFRKTI